MKAIDYLNKYLGTISRKLVFINPGFTAVHAFYNTPKEAFADFIEKNSVSNYNSLIMLYGEWIVYAKIDDSKLEAIGRIKDIFECG